MLGKAKDRNVTKDILTYCLEYILGNSYEFLSISQFQTETPVQTRADFFLFRTLVISCDYLVFWHWKRSETLVNI